MFWKFDLHSSSHIDTLLEREDVTLKELMDEEDVLQECKAQNRKLIEFLLKAECLEDLVSFIIEEPPQDMDEKIRYKYPNISCELLTSDVSQMNDRLGEDESLLMKLYSFLLNESPLNPLLASFFSKVLSILISRKPEQIVDFLKKKRDFVDLIIKHIGTSAIMAMEASSDGEEDAESTDKVTETVMNGGMKETLSLTVDAKTETAVFKSEEEKLSTSQDAACKDAEETPEPAEAKCTAPLTPSSSPEQRTDQPSMPSDPSVNGPV